MLLNTSNASSVISHNFGHTEYDYSIVTNAKAFKVLSDTLYQNKIGSIVREISSNAYDAHIAAGTPDLPFEIHLPDVLEPYFSVKDYGIGLSPDDIRKVYTCLFLSTKDNSNEQVGSFGLGGKTPFSITDSFTVISIYNGVKYTYSIIIKDDGMPSAILLSEENTSEHNGVEVIVPVDNNISKFIEETKNQLRFFKVKPTIKNNSYFEWENVDHNVSMTLTNFKVLKQNMYSYTRQPTYIVQGGVGYPLDASEISQSEGLDSDFFYSVIRRGAIIYFDIGEIEVTPSREGISYVPHTIKNIVNKFEQCRLEFYSTLEAKLDAFSNNWERAVWINESGDLVANAIKDDNKFGIKITNNQASINIGDAVKNEKEDGTKELQYNYTTFTVSSRGINMKQSVRNSYNDTCLANNKNYFVMMDKCSFNKRRLRELLRSKADAGCIWAFYPLADDVSDNDIRELSEKMGGAPIIRCSSLALPEKESSERDYNRGGYTIPKLYRHISGEITDRSNYERVYDKISDIDGGYYLVIPAGGRTIYSFANSDHVEFFKNMYLLEGDIYAIRERDVKKIENDPNWIPLDKKIQSIMENISNDKFSAAKMAYKIAMSENRFQSYNGFRLIMDENTTCPLVNYCKKFVSYKNMNYAEIHEMKRLYRSAGIQEMVYTFHERFEARINKIKEKYPLLFCIDESEAKNITPILLNYIEQNK